MSTSSALPPGLCTTAELPDDTIDASDEGFVAVNGSCHELGDLLDCEDLEALSLSDGDTELDMFTCPSCRHEYKQPRVLSCLHIFCESCLKPLLTDDSIACPTCKVATETESVSELPLDYVIANGLDMKGIEGKSMACTSCKAKENAISRCSDCANFLCPNCVTAHQFMRCFENHKVVSFADITKDNGVDIHRPIMCTLHGEEQPMRFFCVPCQMPICNECMVNDHQSPSHTYEKISDIENREMHKMKALMDGAAQKVDLCEKSSCNLQQSLTELESQRDDAKSLINETFQSYKALLEKRQVSLLAQLEELHKQQELSVMEMFNNVNTTVDKIERGSLFVKRVVEKSNTLELLCLKKVISQHMSQLLNQPLGDNVSVDIQFVTDNMAFSKAVTEHFGHFKLRDDSVTKSQQQQHQIQQLRQIERQVSRANLANEAGYNVGSPNLTAAAYGDMGQMGGHNHMGMLGSPDSGLCNDSMRPILSNDFALSTPFASAGVAASDQLGLRNASVTSLSGMNAGIIGDQVNSQSRQSQSPTVSDSGIGMDSSSPGIQNNPAPPFNLATLAKHGTVTVSPSGNVLLNNHSIPGLTINNVTGYNSSYHTASGREMTMSTASSSPDQDLHLSHGSHGGMFSPPPISGRYMTPSNSSTMTSMDTVMGGSRRESVSNIGMAMSGGGGGGSAGNSGFASPTPGQFGAGPSFPLRSKMSAMQIRHKFGSLGPAKVQFNSPHGFCMGFEEDIVVADTNNHRIQVFDKSGEFKYQFGVPGREEGQLWYPRKVAVMRGTSRYVICDRGNERSRMQIFSKNGHFVKKIAIRYIDIVAGLAITSAGNIVAVDSVSPTVFTIAESGDLIKWFDCSDYMREPSDIAVADKEYYVCDFKGHCVVVFNDDGQFQRRIGTDTITNYPNGIDISDAGDVLVGDSHGNRFHVAVFQRDGSLIGEFECPYVKVSRCCGLKITSEGYVVTLAKNNHHVLVLNTLYIS